MSTAGKVLVVLVILGTVVWMALVAGVAQLDTNYSKVLHDLEVQYQDLTKELETDKSELATLQDKITVTQDKTSIELTVLEARLAALEKTRSQIVESLTSAGYQLAIVNDSIKSARETVEHKIAEQKAEEKELADARSEVQALAAESSQLSAQLETLRQRFRSTYQSNREMLGK